jgi:hypothetical protein
MTTNKRQSSRGFIPDSLQINRRANLRSIIEELESDGVESALLIDQVLGMATGTVANVRKGAEITDAMAREIEWAMNRPSGWLDRGPKETDI